MKVWQFIGEVGDIVWQDEYSEGETPDDAMQRWNEMMEDEEYVPELDDPPVVLGEYDEDL